MRGQVHGGGSQENHQNNGLWYQDWMEMELEAEEAVDVAVSVHKLTDPWGMSAQMSLRDSNRKQKRVQETNDYSARSRSSGEGDLR